MPRFLGTRHTALNAQFKQHEKTVVELQRTLLEQLVDFQKEFDLDFIQVERVRQYLEDKGTLFRFLRRAAFDFNAALNSLTSEIRWRIENGLDALTLFNVNQSLLQNGLFFFHKTDKFNRPCAILNMRHYKHDEDGSPTVEELKCFILFNVEIARRLMWDMTKESSDSPVLQFVILLDLKGASVSNLDFELGPFLVDTLRHHFPGSVAALFVLNYSWMYSGVWQILKRVLPEESLSRVFFPAHEEFHDFFDEENLLIEHGGTDTYVYEFETCKALQVYGRPSPLLRMPAPLSRASSFDSVHDVFFSAHSTPYTSRPATPHHSRPASPIFDHIPNWLMMTPSNTSITHDSSRRQHSSEITILSPQPTKPFSTRHLSPHSPLLKFTNLTQNIPSLFHDHNIKPIAIPSQEEHWKKSSSYDSSTTNSQQPNGDTTSTVHPSKLHRLIRFQHKYLTHITNFIRNFIARRVSGAMYWLVFVVIFRGGLVNEFWMLVTQRVTMQLLWNASTTTALTTAALSAALSGRTRNRLLLG